MPRRQLSYQIGAMPPVRTGGEALKRHRNFLWKASVHRTPCSNEP